MVENEERENAEKEVAGDVVEFFSMERNGVTVEGRLLRDGTIGFYGDDLLRLTAEQAKPPKRRRLGPADPAALLLSPAQVGVMLGCGRDTVDDMIREGTLPAVPLRSGRRKRLLGIPKKAVESFIAQGWKKSRE